MVDRLKDKVAIVTGSTQGIGRAVARLFLEEGASVVLNSARDDEFAGAARREFTGERALYVAADIASPAQVEAMVAAAVARFGRVDVVVNNAGVNVFADPLKITADEWRRCFAVDLDGAWNVTRAALPNMLERGAGSVVNIASVHGHKIIPGCFPYPVAKHGLIGLTRALGVCAAERF